MLLAVLACVASAATLQELTVLSSANGVLDATLTIEAVEPSPATHAILAQLKAGECIRHSI